MIGIKVLSTNSTDELLTVKDNRQNLNYLHIYNTHQTAVIQERYIPARGVLLLIVLRFTKLYFNIFNASFNFWNWTICIAHGKNTIIMKFHTYSHNFSYFNDINYLKRNIFS